MLDIETIFIVVASLASLAVLTIVIVVVCFFQQSYRVNHGENVIAEVSCLLRYPRFVKPDQIIRVPVTLKPHSTPEQQLVQIKRRLKRDALLHGHSFDYECVRVIELVPVEPTATN